MFSQSIQNLIDTSGKQAAVQRITQINNYVNTLTNNDVDPSKNVVQSFNDVLKSSKAEDSRFKVSNDENISLNPTQNFVNPSKPQILQLISKIAQKYDMDENLIKAVVKQESGFKTNAVSNPEPWA
jgi:soluble lytic murein transglycosylase-like protein